MNFLWSESFSKHSSKPLEQDILIKSILLTHDRPDDDHQCPDDRICPEGCDLDTEMLLRLVEYIMYHATPSQVSFQQRDFFHLSSILIEGSHEPLSTSIYKISCEILCKFYEEENAEITALSVLNLLGSYKWEAKLTLVLSAFAMVYGQFWVITQSHDHHSLAASIASLKHIPNDFNVFHPVFVALTSLVKTIVDLIRCVMQVERLPMANVELPEDTITSTKSSVYAATYWVVQSIMVCISLVANLGAIKDEQEPNLISATVWEISSLKHKINSIGTRLRVQMDACQLLTEKMMHNRLLNLFQGIQTDNQEVLKMLFAYKNNYPLKHSSKKSKLRISSLKNKVVILFMSTTDQLQPMEELFFLIQQTYNHPLHSKIDGSYDILWFPISPSNKWSSNEVTTFVFLSNSLPWYSVRQPWSLSPIAIKFAKEEWQFDKKPIMVVLSSNGKVTNVNAIDMVRIWGAKAYPFSKAREIEMWLDERWNLRLLLDINDPILSAWVEEGRPICIYASHKLDWIRKFSKEIKEIQCLASHLKVVYVGSKNQSELVSSIVSVIEREKLSYTLSLTKIYFFWCRLESMKRSKLSQGQTTDSDDILRGLETMLSESEEEDEDWVIFGSGSSTNMVKLQATKWNKFLTQYSTWEKYLPKIGLEDMIRLTLDPPASEKCSHSKIIRFNEGLREEKICEKCKRPVEKFFMYDVE